MRSNGSMRTGSSGHNWLRRSPESSRAPQLSSRAERGISPLAVPRARSLAALVMTVIAACSPGTATPAPLPTVVVVSFDALGDRYLDRDTLPHFRRMISEGVRAPFRPQFPSKTFPNHYSMATGLTPGEHGIVVNSFFDPQMGEMFLRTSASEGKWFGGEPIWVTAEKSG